MPFQERKRQCHENYFISGFYDHIWTKFTEQTKLNDLRSEAERIKNCPSWSFHYHVRQFLLRLLFEIGTVTREQKFVDVVVLGIQSTSTGDGGRPALL